MTRYFMDSRTKITSRDMGFCHSREIYLTNMGKSYWALLQKRLDAAKVAFKKFVLKQPKQQDK